jgi:hypothetical protein
LHRRRRLHPGAQRLQRDRARHRRRLPGRPAAGEGGDRRDRDGRRTGRLRHAHQRLSGTCDYPADTEDDAIRIGRDIVAQWELPKKWSIQQAVPEPPLYDPDELYGIIPDDIKKGFEMREVIARIVDGSRFHEYQPAYGNTLVCGLRQYLGLQDRHPGQ